MKLSFLFTLTVATVVASSFAAKRVGPVSQYGQLNAGKNSSQKGQIYGSCPSYSTSGHEVQVQGMSLFWSIASDVGAPFWTSDYVDGLVDKQNIQIIRAPMGVDEDWGSGNYFTNTSYYQGLMDVVVQSAINNDIYVIIDYHSHKASDNVENAKTFFKTMAEKWGTYDNVIFEVFNEPTTQSWSTIKQYADAVISVIRQYSDNLVLVGSSNWDQKPNDAINNPINGTNVAYTFHFYAGIDGGGQHDVGTIGKNAESAMNAGLSVFVSEWGNSGPQGDGTIYSDRSTTWLNWMNQHKLSAANWAVSSKAEKASYFSGSAWNYSESGIWVNSNIFAKLPKSYTACSDVEVSSSSATSSSSAALPEGYTDYIDDFEDGDSLAYTGGIWYAYTDNGDDGASTISNEKNVDAKGNLGYKVVIKADNSSNYMGALTGVKLDRGSNEYEPYVALGVKLNADESAYDLSACKTISYKYKGAAHNFKTEDTSVMDYGYHQISKLASTTWTTANISWDMLSQPSWVKAANAVQLSKKRINKFTWEIKGDLKGTQPTQNYLYIDDVRCDGMQIKKIVANSSSSTSKSSSSKESSSSTSKSSSSGTSSSSMSSSSSVIAAGYVVNGSLHQTVVAGGTIETITITGITSFNRDWRINFVDIPQQASDGKVVIQGKVQDWAPIGDATETLTINGEKVTLSLTVVSSSSNDKTAIAPVASVKTLNVSFTGCSLEIASANAVDVEVFNMQGALLKRMQATGSVSLESLQQGNYIVRVQSGSANWIKRISIR